MRHEVFSQSPHKITAALNHAANGLEPEDILALALATPTLGRIALVSSFGAQSVVLLHMVARLNPAQPVLFLDTGKLFAETLQHQRELTQRLGLTDVRILRPAAAALAQADPHGHLHKSDPDACCHLRKTEPLENALAPFDTWITGRKRFQGGARATLEAFEGESERRFKINPLVHWDKPDIARYMKKHDLPAHPLIQHGFSSIGCIPCTSKTGALEPERAGRWRGFDKTECGIHVARSPAQKPSAEPAPEPQRILVTDAGFAPDDWNRPVLPFAQGHLTTATALQMGPNDLPDAIIPHLPQIGLIRIDFPIFSDGRGFTLARQLRELGFAGRLRAGGHLIADQYAMARRSGFDEIEISAEMANRQPEAQWLRRANWPSHDYQTRLRAAPAINP